MLIDPIAIRRDAAIRLAKIVKMVEAGASYDEIGRKFKISRQRVHQVIQKAKSKAG